MDNNKIYLIRGNDTPLAVCLRKSEGEGDPVPYDLSTAERMRLALVGHGMHVFAEDIEISGEDDNIVSGVIPGRSLLKGDYDLEVTFNLDGRDKRFAVKDMFEAVDFLAEDADGEAEGEGAGIFVTVTVQPELIEISGPTGPRGKSAYQVWLDDGHTGTEDDFFEWLAAQTPNPDWEQNDPSKADYIKGRTHYEETSTTTINNASLAWSGSTPEDLDFWFRGTDVHIPRTSAGWGLTWEGGELFIDDIGTGYEIGVFDGEGWSYNPFDPSYDPQPYPLNVDVVIASETVHKLPNKFLDMDTEPTTGSGKPVTSGGVKAAIADFVTRAVNDLLNYYTKTETYTKAEVNQLVAGINNWEIVPVAQLPVASADTMHKIYLVPSSNPKTKNVKDEFITVEVSGAYSWEQIGTTAIDLTNYVTRQDLTTALADYVTSSAFTQALALKQDVIADLLQIREGATDTVKYTSQTLTDAQKGQARANIGAADAAEVSQLRSEVDGIDAGDTSSYQLLPGFIGQGGAVNSHANWRHTTVIPVSKGATITVVTAGTAVCVIAQDNNGTYTPLVLSNTSGDSEILNTYSYVAQDDINVSVSLKVSVSGYSISVNGKLDLLTDKTEKLENDLNGELLKLNTTRRNYSTGLYYAGTGELVAYPTWFVSNDYVPVSKGDFIVWNPGAATGSASLVLYDVQKNRINFYGANAESREIKLDIDNVAYMRASFALSNIDNAKLIVNNKTVWVPKDGNNEGVEGDVDLQKELLLPDMGFAMVRPGTCGGLVSYTAVTTEIMPVKGGEYVTIITNRPNREGCVYKFGLCGTTDINDIGKIGTASAVITGTVTPSHTDIDIDMPNGKGQFKLPNATVGAMFVIGEYNTNNERQPLNPNDFAGYYIAIGHYADPELAIRCDVEQSFDNNQKYIAQSNIGLTDVLRDEDMGFEGQEYKIVNGSQGNGGNAWVVTLRGITTMTIPVTPGHIYKLVFRKKPETGFHFYWRIGTYSTPNGANLYSNLVRDEYNSWNVYHTETDTFDIRAGEYGLSIQLTELTEPGAAQTSETCIALRYNSFAPGDIVLLDVTKSEIYHTETVVDRNSDKIPALVNACLRGKASANSKNLQLLVCADSHGYKLGHDNAVLATNGFDTIDAYVHVGDIMPSSYQSTYITRFQREFSNLTKPGYVVVGNHDVGNCYYAGYSCDHQQAYEAYIEPMVDNGWLASGEYETGKPYWFHDNSTYKVRFIGLYEYDDNLDFNETYWKAIEYDSTLSKITYNTAYQVGAKVNAGDHTSHSFEAVQNVTTPANYYTTPSKLPSYIVKRGTRVIRQTQAQWFLDTLASTPASYGVIVIMHNPFSDNAVSMEKKFSWPANVNGSLYSQNSMTTDFVRNAIAAFMAGSNYSEKVVMKGDAAYLNTLNDGTIDYAYEVSKNFAQKNTGVYLLGLLGGHSHRDIIWKDPSQNIYQVAPNCAIVDGNNDKNGDVRRTNTDGIAADSLTVVSFSSGRIALVKIGVNVTENGTDRDYEVISY